MLAFAAVMTAAFLWIERRAAEPIIPLGLFRSSIVAIAAAMAALTAVAMFGTTLFIPLFFGGATAVCRNPSTNFCAGCAATEGAGCGRPIDSFDAAPAGGGGTSDDPGTGEGFCGTTNSAWQDGHWI